MNLEAGKVLVSKEQIAKRVAEMAKKISSKHQGHNLFFVGILRGAAIFMSDLVRQIDPSIDVVMDYMKASSYGASTVSSGEVTITLSPTLPFAGKYVIIVEDIVDTGLTLKKLREYFAEHGAASVEVCSLLNKKERRTVDVEIEYVGFEIPDEFVIGYGMDYDEKLRNLPDVHVARILSE